MSDERRPLQTYARPWTNRDVREQLQYGLHHLPDTQTPLEASALDILRPILRVLCRVVEQLEPPPPAPRRDD